MRERVPRITVRVHLGSRRLRLPGATQRRPIRRPSRDWVKANETMAGSLSEKLNVVPTGSLSRLAVIVARALPSSHRLAAWRTRRSDGEVGRPPPVEVVNKRSLLLVLPSALVAINRA